MIFLYFSPVMWGDLPQRSHRMIEWIYKTFNCRIIWINPHPTRLPRISDPKSKFGSSKLKSSQPPWLIVLTLRYFLPIAPFVLASKYINYLAVRRLLKEVNAIVGHEKLFLGIGKPSDLVTKILRNKKIIFSFYDAMDDFPEFYSGISRKHSQSIEAEIISLVDQIYVVENPNKTKFKKFKDKVFMIPNGVDIFPYPLRVSTKDALIFGYVGTIGEWFDWNLVVEIANRYTNSKVYLIGRLHTKLPKNLPGNIKLLGELGRQESLEMMAKFSFGLIPFKLNSLTESVDPIKYYEYLSLGVPVVSTKFGSMKVRQGQQGVSIIHTGDAVNESIIKFQDQTLSSDWAENFNRENYWGMRFNNLLLPLLSNKIK